MIKGAHDVKLSAEPQQMDQINVGGADPRVDPDARRKKIQELKVTYFRKNNKKLLSRQ